MIFVEQASGPSAYRVVIDWPWKLILDDVAERAELYHLVHNPLERHQRRHRSDPSRERRMRALIDSVSTQNAAWRGRIDFTGEMRAPTARQLQELRALGYVNQ